MKSVGAPDSPDHRRFSAHCPFRPAWLGVKCQIHAARSFSMETAAAKYKPQLRHDMWLVVAGSPLRHRLANRRSEQ